MYIRKIRTELVSIISSSSKKKLNEIIEYAAVALATKQKTEDNMKKIKWSTITKSIKRNSCFERLKTIENRRKPGRYVSFKAAIQFTAQQFEYSNIFQ